MQVFLLLLLLLLFIHLRTKKFILLRSIDSQKLFFFICKTNFESVKLPNTTRQLQIAGRTCASKCPFQPKERTGAELWPDVGSVCANHRRSLTGALRAAPPSSFWARFARALTSSSILLHACGHQVPLNPVCSLRPQSSALLARPSVYTCAFWRPGAKETSSVCEMC